MDFIVGSGRLLVQVGRGFEGRAFDLVCVQLIQKLIGQLNDGLALSVDQAIRVRVQDAFNVVGGDLESCAHGFFLGVLVEASIVMGKSVCHRIEQKYRQIMPAELSAQNSCPLERGKVPELSWDSCQGRYPMSILICGGSRVFWTIYVLLFVWVWGALIAAERHRIAHPGSYGRLIKVLKVAVWVMGLNLLGQLIWHAVLTGLDIALGLL